MFELFLKLYCFIALSSINRSPVPDGNICEERVPVA